MSAQTQRAEFVMRSIAIMACATALSLFTTIAAYAAVNVVTAKNDGLVCKTEACASVQAAALAKSAKPAKVARVPSHAL